MMLSVKRARAFLLTGAALILGQAIGACDGDQPPQTSSATHFLEDCAASCSAGLSCLCGVCTRPCQASSECTGITANATCVVSGDAHPTCGSSAPSRLCDVRCNATADCDGTPGAPLCLSGFCRSLAAASAGPDAASPSSGGMDGGPRPSRDSGTGGSSGETGAPGMGGVGASGSGGAAGNDAGSGGAVTEAGSTPTPDGGAGADAGSGTPGCEARVLYDPKNCGRCGHDCLGGGCVSGICAPVILAVGQDDPATIAVDDTHVYWATNTSLNKVSKAGGQVLAPVTALFTGKSANDMIALDDATVFFAYGDPETLASVPKGGGRTSLVAQVTSGHLAVATDANNLYWSTLVAVFQKPLNGGPQIQIATSSPGQSTYPKIAVDSANVYWLDVNQKLLQKTPIGGGATVSLASTDVYAVIAVYGGFVYWTNITSFGSVSAVAIDGSSTKTVADSQDTPAGIAVDASGVYWTNQGASGTVLTRSIDGGPITVLATNQGIPGNITTDATAVYWTSTQTGLIMKIAKP